jgi:glycosyltransferase involved in cell wall biosynthesis
MITAPDPFLTIVVPTLNSSRTLSDTLSSLRTAGQGRIRLVVVDSASTDATPDICRQYGVEVLQAPAGNIYRAINVGLRTATTPWLGYVNSDDYVFPQAYSFMLDRAVHTDASVAYGRGDYVNSDGAFLHSLTPPKGSAAVALLKCGIMPFLQPAAIFRRESWTACGGFREMYRLVADFDFFCRLALSGCRFERFTSDPVIAFRLSSQQLSTREADNARREHTLAVKTLKLSPTAGDLLAWAAWKIKNVPSYCGRVIRYSSIAGKLLLPRSGALPFSVVRPESNTR